MFIYLHIARNAIESGTWQYFPIVDRGALLASSPLKLVLLTVATAVAHVVGYGARSLDDAQVVLLLTGLFGWLLFLPFWRGRTGQYAIAGVVYFLSATALASAFDFEGGCCSCGSSPWPCCCRETTHTAASRLCSLWAG